jgi:cytochrome b
LAGESSKKRRIRLWDLPVRLVHWSLVALLPSLWWTWHSGRTQLHEKLGYLTLGLLLFRILWGIFGSSTARFVHFVKGPRAIAAYLSGRSPARPGHNPLGALSVLALLGLMIIEVGLGLFAQDVDGIEAGSLAKFVSYDTAEWARDWHAWLFNIILAVVALHVLAILFYLLIKRDNLVGPMVTGRKEVGDEVVEPAAAPAWRGLVTALIAAAAAWWISKGLPWPGA